ncbi:hypothetical protein ACLB2K_058873 [Fragaria x ananassa]
MTMSKAFSVCIIALLVCSLCIDMTNARELGYGALRDDQPSCRGKNPCMSPPSNTYNRGCEKENDCRGGQISSEGDRDGSSSEGSQDGSSSEGSQDGQ